MHKTKVPLRTDFVNQLKTKKKLISPVFQHQAPDEHARPEPRHQEVRDHLPHLPVVWLPDEGGTPGRRHIRSRGVAPRAPGTGRPQPDRARSGGHSHLYRVYAVVARDYLGACM